VCGYKRWNYVAFPFSLETFDADGCERETERERGERVVEVKMELRQ
jgi:hypothetical protein